MEAVDGYWAAIECRSVQVERPRTSTSGGHSVEGSAKGSVEGEVVEDEELRSRLGMVLELEAPEDLAIAIQLETEVQERQLGRALANY